MHSRARQCLWIICAIACNNIHGPSSPSFVVDAFSTPSSYQRASPQLATSNTIIINPHQRTLAARRTRSRSNEQITRLYEQPINIKNLLGPISPSTLDKYNLPPSTIEQGWSAQIVTKTAKSLEEGTQIQLVPKNAEEHFVDSFQVEIPIPLNSIGLGIELLEIQGGRSDGLGIVIVNGLVAGGNAENAVITSQQPNGQTIMIGDSIVSAELIMDRKNLSPTNKDQVDVDFINTECLGYDATIEALVGMLSSLTDNEHNIKEAKVVLTLKRLRRRPAIDVTLHYPPSQNLPPAKLSLQPGDNLRLAMLQRGVALNDPLAQRYDGKISGSGNCGGGALCRTCAVSVLRGGELMSRPKLNERKIVESEGASARWRLACKSWVGYGMEEGEIVVQVNPRQW